MRFLLNILTILILLSGEISFAGIDHDLKTKLSESHFKSYHEFAKHACIPCHSGENGTNLVKLIDLMTESDLRNYLDTSLNYGKMPPDEVFRKVLLDKFLLLPTRDK
ncbi:MAG: hypothetical protein IMF12_09785 [Proteobacteria bacterium]|nr:hypothetical protein [Pseudomonadota bacterium]